MRVGAAMFAHTSGYPTLTEGTLMPFYFHRWGIDMFG